MLVPVLTTPAGACLTVKNWEEVQVQAAAFYLDALLIKPGYSFLQHLPDLARYTAWTRCTVLNASHCIDHHHGGITLRSSFDGSRLQHSWDDILDLFNTLQPHMIILPPQTPDTVWQHLPEASLPFISLEDSKGLSAAGTRQHGIYARWDGKQSAKELMNQLLPSASLPRYVTGPVDFELMQTLLEHGISYVETDLPAQHAIQGVIQGEHGTFNLTEEHYIQRFSVLTEQCSCPTCAHALTCAYLHHLFLHTPLLCHRYLIQHNVHVYQMACSGHAARVRSD